MSFARIGQDHMVILGSVHRENEKCCVVIFVRSSHEHTCWLLPEYLSVIKKREKSHLYHYVFNHYLFNRRF